MCLTDPRALFALLLSLCFAVSARAAPIEVSLLLGDLDSITAIEAVRLLRQDPAMREVKVHAFPANDIRSNDLAPLARSRLAPWRLNCGRHAAGADASSRWGRPGTKNSRRSV
jgi:cobaltochelatase CobN